VPHDLQRLLADLARKDPDAASSAEAAASWLVGEDGDLADVSQLRLCEFLWYALPQKFLAPVQEHIAIARATGTLFAAAGLTGHADLCASPTTIQVLRAWDRPGEDGFAAYERALAATGVVPPDVPELSWGETMGFEESAIFDGVSRRLEAAIGDGRLVRGAAAWERGRRLLVSETLATRGHADGRSWLEVIEAERIDMWARVGGEPRRRLAALVAQRIAQAPPVPGAVDDHVAPMLWLLERASLPGGLPLTERHNLARSVVAEAVARFPAWTNATVGSVRNEQDVMELGDAREWLQALGALRRRARQLLTTRRGRELLADADELWRCATRGLIASRPDGGRSFESAVAEAELLVLASGARMAFGELRDAVFEIVRGQGWSHASGTEVTARDVAWVGGHLYARLCTLGLLADRDGRLRDGYQLSETGVLAALTALRAQAVRPLPAFTPW
jgi:hypothetical protein